MVEQVMAYLNLQARRNYRTKNPNGTPTAGAMVIAQRLKEGYTVEQCKDVIGEGLAKAQNGVVGMHVGILGEITHSNRVFVKNDGG